MEQMTIAESNARSLRMYLQLRRSGSLSRQEKRLLRKLVQAHRRYRNDELIKVWSVTVDRSEDVFVLVDGKPDAVVEEIRMSGREFGKLLVSVDL